MSKNLKKELLVSLEKIDKFCNVNTMKIIPLPLEIIQQHIIKPRRSLLDPKI